MLSLFARRMALARIRNTFVPTTRKQSTGSYQPPSSPGQQGQGNPHGDFYKTFGRPVIKNFLIAVLTYQLIYYSWKKLESIEVKREKEDEMKALEGELRGLTANKRTT